MTNVADGQQLSNKEIGRRGEALYTQILRSQVETDANVGKIIAVDIDTGDYEIDTVSLAAAERLRVRKPGATIYALRIGYDAVYALGTSLLDGYDVRIQFTDGGVVIIERI